MPQPRLGQLLRMQMRLQQTKPQRHGHRAICACGLQLAASGQQAQGPLARRMLRVRMEEVRWTWLQTQRTMQVCAWMRRRHANRRDFSAACFHQTASCSVPSASSAPLFLRLSHVAELCAELEGRQEHPRAARARVPEQRHQEPQKEWCGQATHSWRAVAIEWMLTSVFCLVCLHCVAVRLLLLLPLRDSPLLCCFLRSRLLLLLLLLQACAART